MLSIANVRSPSAAASYFADDNYYARADADRSGQWVGEGAKSLGLTGRVETKQFDALLRGELPDGSSVGNPGQAHRPGTDLTFSMPKSWSLLALVGKDERIVTAYREAVTEALNWAEKNAAETRLVERSKVNTVATAVGMTDAPLHSYFALVADDPSVQIVSNAQTWYISEQIIGTEYEGLPILSAAAPFKAISK